MNARDIDASTVEVVRNYLNSAAAEMQRTLMRTAYNTIIYEILDFGISLYDRRLQLIADSPGLTLFLGANDYAIGKGVEYVGEENLEDGDIVMMNYPYWSGTHTLDVFLFSPVFLEDHIVGYATSRAHWLDLGAKDPGYLLDSTEIHQEGLIFPGTKVFKRGEPDQEILELIRYNSRTPDTVIGDLHAEVAAINTGKRRLGELYQKYGEEVVEGSIQRILEHGETTARKAVADLPDGSWTATDFADGFDRPEGDLIRMEARVEIEGERFTVDFSGSDDQVDEPLNVPIGMTQTIAKFCFKAVTTPNADSNAGQYRPLEVVVPEGNLYHPVYPAPCFTIWPGILGIDVVLKALAQALPGRSPASSGGDLCDIMLYGRDPETGHYFVEANNDGVGWGANWERDGPNALMHVSETRVKNLPVEVMETKAPVLIDRLELRKDSGGPGERRGGLGIRRDYRFTESCGALSIIQKTKTDGWGLEGGEPGARNAVVLYPGTDKEEHTGMMRGTFNPGDVISNRTGGGGGIGDPLQRDPERVREDAIDGYVSRNGAREDYRVVLDEDLRIDWEATEALRGK
ncbi:MAG: hydantoinase B/oxoprolinase family protein [Gemmatimonadota bacterium]